MSRNRSMKAGHTLQQERARLNATPDALATLPAGAYGFERRNLSGGAEARAHGAHMAGPSKRNAEIMSLQLKGTLGP